MKKKFQKSMGFRKKDKNQVDGKSKSRSHIIWSWICIQIKSTPLFKGSLIAILVFFGLYMGIISIAANSLSSLPEVWIYALQDLTLSRFMTFVFAIVALRWAEVRRKQAEERRKQFEDKTTTDQLNTMYIRTVESFKKKSSQDNSFNVSKNLISGIQHIIEDSYPTVTERKKARARYLSFIYMDLSNINLESANLEGANLYKANLGGAHLRGASLRGAYLRGSNLSNVDLRGAHLRNANLSKACLIDARLKEANLAGAKINENVEDPFLVFESHKEHIEKQKEEIKNYDKIKWVKDHPSE